MSDYNPREWHADPSASSAVTAYATFTDPGSAAETYSCSVNYGDGTVVLGVVSGLTCTGPLHQYLVSGTYKVTVTVIDNGGASGVGTTGATYQNWAPWVGGGLVGSFTVGSVVNDVAAIVDPGAAFETYTCTVDYGDGTGVHAGTYVPNGWSDGLPRCVGPDHVYQAPGSYSIITTATDSAGATGSSLVIETIIRTPIVVGPVSVSGTAFVGSPFSASATFTQSGQTNACTVDYGDGSGPVAGVVTGSACQGPQHTYTAVGSFTISISVSDSNGGLGSSSLTVTTQVAPQVGPVVAPSPLVEGQAFVASASFSALAPARCTVDFGNGTGTSFGSISGSTCSAPNYMYPAPGTYTLTFTITDARGFTATAGATVVIGNVAPVVYDLLTSGTPSAGGVVTAQANFSHPALGIDTYACTIDFGDGTSPETGVIGDADCTADHTYSQGGLYTVTMTVTDNTGGSGSASVSEPIANLRPTVGPITVSGALTENGVVHASASFTDPWSVANYYMCSVDYGDGHGWTVWVATDHACIDAPMHFYDDAGTFTVTLEVDRGYGEVAIATTTVTVANVAPTVVPIYAPVPEQSGVSWVPSVGFTDPGSLGAETYACTIDFGDGTGAMAGVISGIVCTGPSHSYASKGSYTMVATVTDSHGASGTYSVTIVIYNAAPTVGPVVAPASAVVGSAVVASAGYVSTGLAPADTCTVDYGDGSGPLAGTADGAKCTGPGHKYAATGTFTIVVKLQAANGAAATSSATIKVSSLQVGAVSVNGTLLEGSSVVASAGFTPVGSQTYKCKVDYGDGSGAQTGTISGTTCKGPSHKYGGPGSFTISVSVTGSKGNTGASTMTVVVANVLPVVTATLPSTAKIGTLVTLSASFTDPGTTETYQVVVDWNDGSGRIPIQLHGRSFSASHTYTKAGDYPVVVEVSDDQGAHAVTAVPQVAIYDPARSVSGSGTFASPAGACTLTSKCVGASTATFSLSAAYAKGATVPTGTFTFSAAGISFTATSFDWYMAPDGVGILYGHGKVNGVSGYHFSVVTLDGSPDKILVDLVGADGFSVYHNGDYTPLKTGSITMK
jgi:PKD repeat protein